MTLLDRADGRAVGLASALGRHGGRTALVTPAGAVSYGALATAADRVAADLGPVRRLVLVPMANDLGSVVGYLGALRGGHVVLLTSPREDHVDRQVGAFAPDVVLRPGPGAEVALDERHPTTAHALHPELALLLSTSGSTGSPRLVRLSHENLDANAGAIAEYLGLTPEDRAVTTLPLHYCYGLSVLHSHLAVGASVVLTELSVVDRCFWDLFRGQACTSLAGVPHTFDLLERVGFAELELPSLRYVTQAGGRLAPERVARLAELGSSRGWDLVVMYGQTEATARMAYLPPALAASHPGAVGLAVPGGAFALAPVDEPVGEGVGEVVYTGPNVMLGYAEHPDDLALGRTTQELRTGDLGRWTGDGLLEIVGRRSRFAKLFGLRLDLEHLEAMLRDAGFDALCAADDERLAVAVVGPADGDVARELLCRASGLPRTRVGVVVLDELPRRPNGKPDPLAVRRAVALADDGGSPTGPAPRADTPGIDPRVRAAVLHVLPGEDPTADDTFVDLGGDSLSYVEMSIALEEVLGHLPDGWPTTPLGRLVPDTGRRTRWAAVDTSVVLRAVAITLVVGMHIKLHGILGGAHLLLAIAGWNFGRFTVSAADRLRSVARIAVPSALWLALAAATVSPRIRLDHVLLVHGWVGDPADHGGYWYVEAIVQILLPIVALLAVPAVARLDARRPLAVPGLLAAAGLAVRFGVVDLPTVEPHDIRPHDIAWLFALGWCAGRVHSTRGRLLVSAVALVSIPGYFGEPYRELLVSAGFLLVLWLPTVPVPRLLAPVVGKVAAASLYVYLTHWQVFEPVGDRLGRVPALVASLAVGVAVWWLAGRAEAVVRRRWAARRAAPRPSAGQGSPAPVSVAGPVVAPVAPPA